MFKFLNTKPKNQNIPEEQIVDLFSDQSVIRQLTIEYLSANKYQSAGEINWNVSLNLLNNRRLAFEAKKIEAVREILSEARRSLKQQNFVKYDHKTKKWFLPEHEIFPSFCIVSEEMDAICWMHENLDEENEFEPFCCALLEHCGAVNAAQTEKRLGSGADGGLDGTCYFMINGKLEQVGFESKMWKLDGQVGTDICDKLIGVMHRKKLKYGFIITTGIFSSRCKEQITNEESFKIEMIDQNKLIEMMLYQSPEHPQGMGLRKTTEGIVMNPKLIKDTALKSF